MLFDGVHAGTFDRPEQLLENRQPDHEIVQKFLAGLIVRVIDVGYSLIRRHFYTTML
jgi:hypothetical protein